MKITTEKIEANRNYFAAKLAAEKGKFDVEQKLVGNLGAEDFLLIDARDRDSFEQGHIKGALSVPLSEVKMLMSQLPKNRELVIYCWRHS